jgi:hypothetical protein
MPSKTETTPRRLVDAQYGATAGRPMRWCSLSKMADLAKADAEAVHAAQQDWVELSNGPRPALDHAAGSGAPAGCHPSRNRPSKEITPDSTSLAYFA